MIQIKKRIQAAHDRQKSYTDKRHKPLEFEVGDKVMLKVSPWKGVIRFGKWGKLNPRYIRPFKILAKEEVAFQLLKQKLCSASILALPKGSENFVVYCDASHKGLGAVLMQKEKVITYTSHQLKVYEKNYTTRDLELGAVVFALKMRRHYMYSTKRKEHAEHLKLILELLKKEELYAEFSKRDFWLSWKLCSASILALPKGSENFMVYCDAFHKGLGAVLMQREKFIAYASRQLKIHKKNYNTHDLELGDSVCSQKCGDIIYAQVEAIKDKNFGTEDPCGMIKKLKQRTDGTLCLNGRS
uniref:Putative reverse transcriptase domain-containing protein n=1 Tax=Tanacetum cinerariifolium TaxID=118510 RepID=A0A6L2NCM0_TANCI|nr:putative reverse transcriptase domain-containing protein [Tanacetum cinerariifolium]